ncbi:toxin-antitoxin system YwqK family antitoxin [Carboxylicivirga linearis]|uniref:Toxin-antitoxin system YwqK family antitoxin n=1 Tax=Carboxylicivirga linearis TaxID=1628157 RepID=A0ABS5JXG8_9BACT|nr:toxin-antitoxin system YwqK family antitoxin [Carboxylicivirga linearis]MBS2099617.1 toxin-antitoxin system YwqK family antitoxin [Carboxylicivirga linearis]
MIKNQLLLIGLLMTIINSSCQNNNTKVLETYSDDKIKTMIEYINPKDTTNIRLIAFYNSGDTNFVYSIFQNEKNGLSKFFYKNGQIKYKINYKNDQFHGESKFWYPNGQLWQQASYDNGLLVDTLLDFYENGIQKSIGVFASGKGNLKYYHPNGELWKTGKMQNGKEVGDWIYYYSNGVKSSEGTYQNGLRHGDYKMYFKTGELMESGRYSFNVITESTHYLKNGQIDSELTEFAKRNRNLVPWTEEQKQTFVSNCISDKLKENKNRGDDYCYCFVGKIELFWSYADYLTASEKEHQELMRLIERLCDYE